MLHLFTKITNCSLYNHAKTESGLESRYFCSKPLEKGLYWALRVALLSGILTSVECDVNVVTLLLVSH